MIAAGRRAFAAPSTSIGLKGLGDADYEEVYRFPDARAVDCPGAKVGAARTISPGSDVCESGAPTIPCAIVIVLTWPHGVTTMPPCPARLLAARAVARARTRCRAANSFGSRSVRSAPASARPGACSAR